MAKIEIACFNLESALVAQKHGADRVEFCAEMTLGGTTPDPDLTKELRKLLNIKLHVMIRPRGGDFVYSDEEFDQMKNDIARFKEIGVDGFVFGILDKANQVDVLRNRLLVQLAEPLPCTFHRAFDEVYDFEKSLEEVIACGFTTVLTSGCEPNVDLGEANLSKLVSFADNRIVIMPGGGLRSTNIVRLKDVTKAQFFHSSAITNGTETAVAEEVRALAKLAK